MSVIVLPDPPTLPALPNVEIPDPAFEAWEKSFHVRPCECYYYGLSCGHDSKWRAQAKCLGCDESREAFICEFHMTTYYRDRMVFHAIPCGLSGFGVLLSDIREV